MSDESHVTSNEMTNWAYDLEPQRLEVLSRCFVG